MNRRMRLVLVLLFLTLAAARIPAQRTIPVKFTVPTYGDRQTAIDAWNAGLGRRFDIVGDAPLADNFEDWKGIKIGQFAWTTPSFAQMQKDAERVPKSLKWVFYDFEHWEHTPKAEQADVVGTSRQIRAFATAHGWKAGIAPMYRDGPRLAASLAPFYDAYIVQCQKAQNDARRAETVAMLRQVAKTVHAINPQCLVGCQIGTLDVYGDGTPGNGLKAALATYGETKDFIQIVGVWWPPDGTAMVSFLRAIDQPASVPNSPASQPQPPADSAKQKGAAKTEADVPLPPPPARMTDAGLSSEACRACHTEIGQSFSRDAHAADDFSCVVCHGESKAHLAQDVEGAKPDRTWRRWREEENKYEWRMEKATLEIARLCASCHGKPSAKQEGIASMDWGKFLQTKHGQAVARGDPNAPACTDCHGAHGVSAEPWPDKEILDLCGACHAQVLKDCQAGTHANMKETAPADKSNCVKCHKPH